MKQTAGWMLRKCVRMLVLLLLVSAASFFLVSLSPVDPLQSNVGQAALGAMSQEQVEELKEYWGVGTPALERFLSWLSGVLSGDSGNLPSLPKTGCPGSGRAFFKLSVADGFRLGSVGSLWSYARNSGRRL